MERICRKDRCVGFGSVRAWYLGVGRFDGEAVDADGECHGFGVRRVRVLGCDVAEDIEVVDSRPGDDDIGSWAAEYHVAQQ